MDDARLEHTLTRRRTCAVLWLIALILGITGVLAGDGGLVFYTTLGSIFLLLVTAAGSLPARDEIIDHPRPYRVVSLALFVLALAGSLLGIVPGASELSQVYAVFFLPVTVLAYRTLRARSPTATFGTAAVALLLWVPIFVLTHFGCRPHSSFYVRVPHWTETASTAVLPVSILLVGGLMIAALMSFRPRTDELPVARVV